MPLLPIGTGIQQFYHLVSLSVRSFVCITRHFSQKVTEQWISRLHAVDRILEGTLSSIKPDTKTNMVVVYGSC